ncbi:hypothetical protein SAMN05216431_10293 [Ligilactobacillus sp. WC1T17]|uniref:Uncharacterized protein n=1 Tax=Ligilactobacillus ruminis TaxID=1623 RepID=A0ABY1A9M7_9LACO|nr:hypothetical protein SAMN05216431_10293 [Ligilactobacillus ruminis]
MGLTVNRKTDLDKLFDQFATIEPEKKPAVKPKETDKKDKPKK